MKKTVKRLIALAVSAAVIMAMASCAAQEEGGSAPKLISGGTTASSDSGEGKGNAQAPAATGNTYGLTYKGVLLTPGMDAQAAIKALGEGYVYSEGDSCGEINNISKNKVVDKIYEYKEITIYVSNPEGPDRVNTIEVKDPSVDCGGVKIGSSLDEVKKVYGNPTSEEYYGLRYEKNGTQIQFICADGKNLTSILFKITE